MSHWRTQVLMVGKYRLVASARTQSRGARTPARRGVVASAGRSSTGGSLLGLIQSSYAQTHRDAIEPNGCAAEVEHLNHTWALRFALIDHKSSPTLARIGCGSFAAHTYPRAPLRVVEIAANLISWLFLFDDAWGEGGPTRDPAVMRALFERIEAQLRGAPTGTTPFERALADLCARIAPSVDEGWRERFADSIARYFDGCLLELPFRLARRSPSTSEYRSLRRWSIGGFPVFDLIELTLDAPLDEAMAKKSELRELRGRAAELCAWVNDIWSYEKELGEDEDPLNLVAVLMHDRKLTLPHAFAAAAALYNDDLKAFLELRDQFAAEASTSARELAYVDGLLTWVHGNHAWTQTSHRYRELERVAQRHARGHFG